jgi:RES domain-containing protein
MVYMSATDALAVLEMRVHLRNYIPRTYVFVTAEIPAELIARVEDRESLPSNWPGDLDWTRSAGERFLKEKSSAALSVPSRIVPSSRNILLNPGHPEFAKVTANPPEPFEWDRRLLEHVEEVSGGI